ncbi:MAG: 50S ribosomal protein L1 [Limnohabitans sp.]|jgi:large subunit ribosomal protein L1|nr:50S ribosomal protein L1 [Limnohabitans sp.]
MPTISKRRKANLAAATEATVSPAEAIAALRKFKSPKFDQTVNVVMHLGIDPKQADQIIRGSIGLPHGTGKTARVVCFCQSDKVAAAKAAGAVEAGADDLVAKIEGGWMEFDVAVASPDMMRVVSKLGKVLGPKGLMPSPKAGTVAPDVINAVKEYANGKQEYRNDDGGNVHGVIGKLSFADAKLVENLEAFVANIQKVKPSAAKGTYIKKCVVAACMSPGVQVSV